MASVGSDAVKQANHLCELDNQGTVCLFVCFLAVAVAVGLVRSYGRDEDIMGNDRITYCMYMERHPRGSFVVYPLLSLEVAAPENESIRSTLSSTCKTASQAVLSRMQLTLHAARPTPHGASRLVRAMSAWSVKMRRAPSQRCGDARV